MARKQIDRNNIYGVIVRSNEAMTCRRILVWLGYAAPTKDQTLFAETHLDALVVTGLIVCIDQDNPGAPIEYAMPGRAHG